MVSLASGHYHLSKRKTEELMADFFQANVCLGSVSALERRTSEALREPVEQAREHVQTQSVVHMDETGWREENQRAWLWVAATTWVTVFLIRRSRGSQVAKELAACFVASVMLGTPPS
jgi:transposase-like protein